MSSSYGDDMYYNIGEGSEMDDLDNEVQNISKRTQNARPGAKQNGDDNANGPGMRGEGSEAAQMRAALAGGSGENYVSPDEIRIIIDDDKVEERDVDLETETP